jgi:DNA segregation ATPase FtsK/SpoIIIE, S-DNA-T family
MRAPSRWWCPLRPRGARGNDDRRNRTDRHEQARSTAPSEIGIPRQRDAQTPRLAPPGTTTNPRRQPDARWRVPVRLWAWWRAIASRSVMSARAAGELTRRALCAWWRGVGAVAVLAGRCGPVAQRLMGPAARTAGLAHRVGVLCWRQIEPPLRDAVGWLLYTAPGLVGHLLLRLLGWLPGALSRLLRHTAIGLGWLLARLVRYCLAYPEYAGVVREAHETDRPRRARVAIVAWRRAATRRSLTTLALGLAGWWGLCSLGHTYGTLAVGGLLAVVVGALAGVGRAVRPLPEPEPGTVAAEPGPDEPYPIADAHTRAEAADCVARAARAENIDLRGTEDATRTPWGWQVPVILRRGTPAGLIAKLGDLETTLDLPTGGLLAAPDRTRRARVVLG